jgi:molybdopterin/thiamine biosynthesis adenylyltransferase
MIELDDTNSRYHRQELITWWDQSKLRAGRVLVVGAGAIGNEVVKNLALVGVGYITIVDMDLIEHSNLARCVFFREHHEGRPKSAVLAEEAQNLNSEITTKGIVGPVQRLGAAFLRDFDVVVGALDNREARAWVNQAARKLGITWVDAAIEGLRGLVRMFPPEGACYACTLTESDWKQMAHRKSCALLAPEEILSGKTPTNATTAGVVAAVQVQEVIKLLVGSSQLLSLQGRCWVYTGDSMSSYVTGYQEDPYCLAHDSYELLRDFSGSTLNELLELSRSESEFMPYALDFEDELVEIRACAACGDDSGSKTQFRAALNLGDGRCSSCAATLPAEISSSVLTDHPVLNVSIQCLGFGLADIVSVRTLEGERQHFTVKAG